MTDYEQKIFEQVIDDYFCKAKPRAKIVVEEKKEVHVNGSKLNNNLDESRSIDNGKKKRESKSKALFIEAEYQDNLPSGWKKVVVQRTTGATAGKFDVFFFTPSGRKLRSKNEIKDYSDKNQLNLDLSNFGFSRPRKEKYLAKSPGKKLRPATSTVSPSDNSSNSVTDQSSDITAYDICSSYIVLASTFGTLSFIDKDTYKLFGQLLCSNGRIINVSIAPNEGSLVYGSGTGCAYVVKVPGHELSEEVHPICSTEHEGEFITSICWSHNSRSIYIGDKSGNLSVLEVPANLASSLLKNCTHHLMVLESSIIQLDIHDHYLLVSTLTKSYVCNTKLETYSPIGTKTRQGFFGSCFCPVESSRLITPEFQRSNNLSSTIENAKETSEKQNECNLEQNFSKSKFAKIPVETDTNDLFANSLRRKNEIRIFCARPGSRIWESNFQGNVIATHQIRRSTEIFPTPALVLNDDSIPEEVAEGVVPKTHTPLRHIFKFYDEYLIATSSTAIYIIDPQESRVLLWLNVENGLRDLKAYGNVILFSSNDNILNKMTITAADVAILTLHSKLLVNKCAILCLKYSHMFEKSYLLKQFGRDILNDLMRLLKDDSLRNQIDELRKKLLPLPNLVGQRQISANIDIKTIDSSIHTRKLIENQCSNEGNNDINFGTPTLTNNNSPIFFRFNGTSKVLEGPVDNWSPQNNILQSVVETITSNLKNSFTGKSWKTHFKNQMTSKEVDQSVESNDSLSDLDELVIVDRRRNRKSISMDKKLSEKTKQITYETPVWVKKYEAFIKVTSKTVPSCESREQVDQVCLSWLSEYIETVYGLKKNKVVEWLDDDQGKEIGVRYKSISASTKIKSAKLLLLCIKRNIFLSDERISEKSSIAYQYPQHDLTPDYFKRVDSLYSSIIESDPNLFDYNFLVNSLFGSCLYLPFQCWITLVQKICENNSCSMNQKSSLISTIVSETDFNRQQQIIFLSNAVKSFSNIDDFIITCSTLTNPYALFDFYFFVRYWFYSDKESLFNSIQPSLALSRFLNCITIKQSAKRLYLNYWSEFQEIQFEVIASSLHIYETDLHSCSCGFPVPCDIQVSNLLKAVMDFPIHNPLEVAEIFFKKKFFEGYVLISLKYSLKSPLELICTALQTFKKCPITNVISSLCPKDYCKVLDYIVLMEGSSKNTINCLNCKTSMKISSFSCNHSAQDEDFLRDYLAFNEFVIGNIVRLVGSRILVNLMLKKQCIPRCKETTRRNIDMMILTCLAEKKRNSLRRTLIHLFLSEKRPLFSFQISLILSDMIFSMKNALKEKEEQKKYISPTNGNADKVITDVSSTQTSSSEKTSENTTNENQISSTPKMVGNPNNPSLRSQLNLHKSTHHHWGVKVQLLNGVCQLCQLGLTVDAMIGVTGLTIFSCGHAYHTVCLLQFGRFCIVCRGNKR